MFEKIKGLTILVIIRVCFLIWNNSNVNGDGNIWYLKVSRHYPSLAFLFLIKNTEQYLEDSNFRTFQNHSI